MDCTTDIDDLTISGDVTDEYDFCDLSIGEAVYQDSLDVAAGCSGSYIVYRIWSLTDACGNVADGTQEITIIDTIPPTFTVPVDVTLSCETDFDDLTITGDVIDEADNCDSNIGEAIYTDSINTAAGCIGSIVIYRIWSLTDACGNANTQIQEITSLDTVPPIFSTPADVTLSCETDVTDLIITGDVLDESDNCDSNIGQAVYADSLVLGNPCPGSDIIYRRWSLVDACGNTTTSIQQITLVDTVAPVFTIPADVTLSCEMDPNDLTSTGDVLDESDNCDPNIGSASYVDSLQVGQPCPGSTTILRYWSLSDACGNATVLVQQITLIDTTGPVFSAPPDITISCENDVNDLVIVGDVVDESDNCDPNIGQAVYTDSLDTNSGCPGGSRIFRRWSLSDACGNYTEHIQQIMQVDTVAPVFTVPADVTLSCEIDPADLNFSGDVTDESDNCDPTIGEAIYTDSLSIADPCASEQIIYRLWSLTDGCGNVFSQLQTITFIDAIAPVFSIPPDLTVSCETDPADLTIVGDVIDETDNCDATIGQAAYVDSIDVSQPCPINRVLYRHWSLSDACGNATTQIQVITFIDTIAPLFSAPPDLSLSCETDPSDLTITGDVIDESDNCDATIGEASFVDSLAIGEPCPGSRTIFRIWSLSDACGNLAIDTQQLVLLDTTPPVLDNYPSDITVACDSVPPADSLNALDNCDGNVQVAFQEIRQDGYCEDTYTIQRTWLATDGCGNTSQHVQEIVVRGCGPVIQLLTPDALSVCEQDSVQLIASVPAFYDSTHYQWQFRPDSLSNWSDINNGSDSVLTINPVTLAEEGYYRILVAGDAQFFSDTICSVASDEIYLDVLLQATPSVIAASICLGEQFIFGGNSYDSTGTYIDTLAAVNGCDSISQLNLVVHLPNRDSIDIQICEGDTIQIAGQLVTSAGTYRDSFVNINNCDSVVIYEVELLPILRTDLIVNICVGDTYEGHIINQDTTIITTFTGVNTCDSIVTTTLFTLPTYQVTAQAVICEGDSLLLGGAYQTLPGDYVDTLSTVNNCDSILTTTLIVNPVNDTLILRELCVGDSLFVGGAYQSDEGVYTDYYLNMYNCDSIVYTQIVLVDQLNVEEEATICVGDSLFVGGAYQTATGIYLDTLYSTDGCDTLLHTLLTVVENFDTYIPVEICAGDSIYLVDAYQTSPGQYIDTLMSSGGCDSIIYYNLAVLPNALDNFYVDICEGDTIQFADTIYTTTGTYTHYYTAANGCDSTAVLLLTVNPSYQFYLSDTICATDSVVIGDQVFNTTGQYQVGYNTGLGCDSTYYLDLLVYPSYEDSLDVEICEGDSIFISGSYQTQASNYTDSLMTMNGCDSIVHYTLSVLPHSSNTLSQVICEGDSIVFGDSIYTQAGVFTHVFVASNGCDSTTTLTLTINPSYQFYLSDTICSNDSIVIGGQVFNQTGQYQIGYTTVLGCDSSYFLDLLVLPSYEEYLEYEMCVGDSIYAGGAYQTQGGHFIDSLLTVDGCDSIIHTQINLNPTVAEFSWIFICVGDSALISGNYESEAGIYPDSMLTVHGCDSIQFYFLSLLPTSRTTVDTAICQGDSILIAGEYQYESGVYFENLINEYGCDSTVVYRLTVHEAYYTEVPEYICAGDSLLIFGNYQSVTGIYTDSMTTVYGCDSVLAVALTVLPNVRDTIAVNLCDGDTYEFQGISYSQDAQFVDTLVSGIGCDSILVIDVFFHPNEETNLSAQICEGQVYYIGSEGYTQSGTYTVHLATVHGCDSTVNLTLEVTKLGDVINRDTICEGESIFFADQYHSISGSYFEEITTIEGCTYLNVLHLVVMEHYEQYFEEIICEGDSAWIMDAWYHSDTTLEDWHTTQFGCDSVLIYELLVEPVGNLVVDNYEICRGDSVQLQVNSSGAVNWTPATGLSCTDCPDPMASPETTTTYLVSTSSCLGTMIEEEVTVYVYEPPIINVDAEAYVLLGDSILLTATANDPTATLIWLNQAGDTLCYGCSEVLVGPLFNQTFTVVAISRLGCVAEEEVLVVVRDECVYADMKIPNFITPNGDGRNDRFRIEYEGLKDVTLLRIYNRWGELIFETTEIDKEHWDGTFRGVKLNPGVYVYYLEGFCLNEKPFFKKGNITIIR